jgi:hypothetical protein
MSARGAPAFASANAQAASLRTAAWSALVGPRADPQASRDRCANRKPQSPSGQRERGVSSDWRPCPVLRCTKSDHALIDRMMAAFQQIGGLAGAEHVLPNGVVTLAVLSDELTRTNDGGSPPNSAFGEKPVGRRVVAVVRLSTQREIAGSTRDGGQATWRFQRHNIS